MTSASGRCLESGARTVGTPGWGRLDHGVGGCRYVRECDVGQLHWRISADVYRKLESEIIPILRKQKGFQHELFFSNPTDKRAFAVSLWDTKENADAYSSGSYAEVTKLLSGLVDGTARVNTYEVSNSTFHKIGAGQHVA